MLRSKGTTGCGLSVDPPLAFARPLASPAALLCLTRPSLWVALVAGLPLRLGGRGRALRCGGVLQQNQGRVSAGRLPHLLTARCVAVGELGEGGGRGARTWLLPCSPYMSEKQLTLCMAAVKSAPAEKKQSCYV